MKTWGSPPCFWSPLLRSVGGFVRLGVTSWPGIPGRLRGATRCPTSQETRTAPPGISPVGPAREPVSRAARAAVRRTKRLCKSAPTRTPIGSFHIPTYEAPRPVTRSAFVARDEAARCKSASLCYLPPRGRTCSTLGRAGLAGAAAVARKPGLPDEIRADGFGAGGEPDPGDVACDGAAQTGAGIHDHWCRGLSAPPRLAGGHVPPEGCGSI